MAGFQRAPKINEEYSDDVREMMASLKNPRYATETANQTTGPIKFDCTLQGADTTFIANERDPHQYGADAWYNAHAGVYGPIGPWVAPPPPTVLDPPYPSVPPPGGPPPQASRVIPNILDRLAALEAKVGIGEKDGNGSRRRKAVTHE